MGEFSDLEEINYHALPGSRKACAARKATSKGKHNNWVHGVEKRRRLGGVEKNRLKSVKITLPVVNALKVFCMFVCLLLTGCATVQHKKVFYVIPPGKSIHVYGPYDASSLRR